MTSEEDEGLLDVPCSEELEYAVSEGGDSLLDSDKETEIIHDVLTPPAACEKKKAPTAQSLPVSLSPPPNLTVSEPDKLLARCRDELGTSKVIRLDRRKKFRCVPDSLPDMPRPKRAQHQKRLFTVRPRKITKPSLLLEVRKGWMAESHNDCRQTLIANCMQRKREDRFTEWKTGRVVGTGHLEEATSELWDGASSEAHSTAQLEQQTYFSTYSPISSPTLSSSSFSNLSSPLPGPPAGLLRVTGTADARVQEDTSSDPHCLEFNPFFTRMKELSEPGPSTNANPFYSALHEKEQSSEIPSCQPESFSFSLSQFTS